MAQKSTIEWTDSTWNPWYGCHKVSPGCAYCYMDRWAERSGRDAGKVTRAAANTFSAPLRWKDRQIVFTCSLSDFFIEEADPWRPAAWDIIQQTPHLRYLILTKRIENVPARLPSHWPLENVGLGISAENQRMADLRIAQLLEIPAPMRFVSFEPLLGQIDMIKIGVVPIDWAIVGGESGSRARPMHFTWPRDLRDQCRMLLVPFFFKQHGEWIHEADLGSISSMSIRKIYHWPDGSRSFLVGRGIAGRYLDGREWNEFPERWVIRNSESPSGGDG